MGLAANVESKVPCSDLLAVADRAKAIGAVQAEVMMQTDTYLAVTGGRLKLRQISQPRTDGTWSSTAELIAYDRPDVVGARVSTYRREPVDDPESRAQALIAEHGLRGVVAKRRELWLLDRTRIHLDDVDGLGTFVELETVAGGAVAGPADWAQHDAVADALGLDLSTALASSYIDLVDTHPKT